MNKQFWMQLGVVAVIGFVTPANVLAVVAIPATVQEAPSGGGNTQYTVNNTSSTISPGGKFDIAIFLSTTTGSGPTTTNANWTAESVDATSWGQNMTGESVTWAAYTGKSYTGAFPTDPLKVNGYFLDYNYNGTDISFPSDPILPGGNLNGFFFTGSPSSTFFVAGPADGTTSFAPGSVVPNSGTSTDTPEPAGICGWAALAMWGMGSRWRLSA